MIKRQVRIFPHWKGGYPHAPSPCPVRQRLVLLGAVCWSLNSPLVKYLTLDPFLICGLRSLIAGLVLLPFVRPREIAWNRYLLAYVLAYCACVSA